jgi:hypothetical protein
MSWAIVGQLAAGRIFVYINGMPKRRQRGRPRTGSRPVVPVRLAPRQLKKIIQLAEILGVDRSTVLRMLIDSGLDSAWFSLLLRRPGTKGRTAVERVIRVAAAEQQVRATQSAVMRAPSVKTEVNALRAEEELEEARAAYAHHHHPKRPRSL